MLNIGLGLNGGIGETTGEQWSSNGGSSASNNFGDSWSNGISEWSDSASGNSWYKVFGSEASAKDVKRAAEANAQQMEFWKMQADYNAQEAEKNRIFQAMMSNTAYQRAVDDLLAAGLNPILAAGNLGATTPVGATASTGLASAHKAQTFADIESGSSWNSSGGGYSKSNSGSHNEGYSNSSWGGSSYGYTMSNMSNNVAEMVKSGINGINKLFSTPWNPSKNKYDHLHESSGTKWRGTSAKY